MAFHGWPKRSVTAKGGGGQLRFSVNGTPPTSDVPRFALPADDVPPSAGAVTWASGSPPSEPISIVEVVC
ncbi:hypothetical protein Dimus_010694 [Dionaea muscipula]